MFGSVYPGIFSTEAPSGGANSYVSYQASSQALLPVAIKNQSSTPPRGASACEANSTTRGARGPSCQPCIDANAQDASTVVQVPQLPAGSGMAGEDGPNARLLKTKAAILDTVFHPNGLPPNRPYGPYGVDRNPVKTKRTDN